VSRRGKPPRPAKSLHSPAEALDIARTLMRQGFLHVGCAQLPNELADLGHPGDELMRKALIAVLGEARPEYYQIDRNPQDTPAHVYVWDSAFFDRRIYLKFKLMGTKAKPVLWLYSCHPAYF
jgi:hypothetical protein